MKRSAAAMICLALLSACGSSDTEETAEMPVETTPAETAPADDLETDPETDPETEPETEPEPADDELPEETAESEEEAAGGTFTGAAETGPPVTITAPAGWELYGAEDAFSPFDIVTAEKFDESGYGQSIVVTDQNLGIGADEVFETTLEVYRDTETHSDVRVLDPITVDGVEFQGLEAVAALSTGSLRIQYWFGEVDGAVLGIYVEHSGDEEIPHSVLDVRDTITFG